MLIRLFSYMNQYKKYAALAVVCIMTEGVFELLVPLIMADLIDVGVANGDRAYIYMKGLQMVGCALIALVLGVGSARFAALTGQGLGAELRKAEYERLQGYSFANIDHFRSSSLVTRLTSDVTNIQNAVSMGMRPFCRGPMMLVVATGVAFSINHTLALVFFVALPILAAALDAFHRRTVAHPALSADQDYRKGRLTFLFALLGVVTVFGFKLRATAAIALIALCIDGALKLWRRRAEGLAGLFSEALRTLAVPCIAFLATAGLSLGLFSSAVNTYVNFDYKNTGFPAVHWVMMSARWDGSFDQNDENYTVSFETKEEKTAADLAILKERIKEAGPLGLVTLSGRKLLNTWVDGTDSYQAEDSYASYGKVYDYLIGNKSGLLLIYTQAFRALEMLVIGLGAANALVRLRRKKKRPQFFLVQLTLLGGMAFHLLWETNPLYSIGFTYLCLMLLADGVAEFTEALPDYTISDRFWITPAAGTVLLALLLVLAKKELVDTPIEAYDYALDQYQYAGGYDGYVTSYDQNYVQTFTTDKPFNRISIRVINPLDDYNQSAFCVRLTDENGTVVYENDRFLSGLVTKTALYEFQLDDIVPNGETAYTLEIWPGYIEGENSLEFLSYTTGNWDLYRDGQLSVSGETVENGDLAFAVYQCKHETLITVRKL